MNVPLSFGPSWTIGVLLRAKPSKNAMIMTCQGTSKNGKSRGILLKHVINPESGMFTFRGCVSTRGKCNTDLRWIGQRRREVQMEIAFA